MHDFIISTLVSVAMGAVVFAVAVRILHVPTTVGRILTLAFGPILFSLPVSLVLGFLLYEHLLIAYGIVTIFQAYVAAMLLRIQAKSQRCEVAPLPSYVTGIVYAVASVILAGWLSGMLLTTLGIT